MNNKNKTPWGTMLLLLGLLSGASHAAIIEYDLTDLGAGQYQYTYTVTNDGSITPTLSLFDLLFDTSVYDELSLTNVSAPGLAADWDPIFLGSAIGVPAAFDVLALNGGLGLNSSVSGFAVQFTWLGLGTPGAQSFEVYDAETFDLLGGGTTTARQSASVPEPGTLVLFAAGIVGLWFARRRANA